MNTEIIHNITLVGIDVYTLFVFHHSRIIFNNNLLYFFTVDFNVRTSVIASNTCICIFQIHRIVQNVYSLVLIISVRVRRKASQTSCFDSISYIFLFKFSRQLNIYRLCRAGITRNGIFACIFYRIVINQFIRANIAAQPTPLVSAFVSFTDGLPKPIFLHTLFSITSAYLPETVGVQ